MAVDRAARQFRHRFATETQGRPTPVSSLIEAPLFGVHFAAPVDMIFQSYSSLVHTLLVGVLAYSSLVLLLRISGKRTLAKWNAFDLIVTVAFGSTLATALTSDDTSLAQTAVAFALLISLQFLVTWTSVRSRTLEQLVKSSPALLVYEGELQHEMLRRERVTEAEVRAAMRSHGLADLREVGALVLETDGSFSLLDKAAGVEAYGLDDLALPQGLHRDSSGG